MDFLDPDFKRRRNQRLMLGYVLTATMIFLIAGILVYAAYGFNLDRKTGEVVHNGLLYVDSAPDKAKVELKGVGSDIKLDAQTNTKVTVPDGEYNIKISKNGYRDWNRKMDILGGTVYRVTYPLLIMSDLKQNKIADFGVTKPAFTTSSPDRRWIVKADNTLPLVINVFDLKSVDKSQKVPKNTQLTLPNIIKPADGTEVFEVVEWSTDNKNFLVKHNYGSGVEFLVINREQPLESVNLNDLSGLKPTNVSLDDKDAEKWYFYSDKDLTLTQVNNKKETSLIKERVTTYTSHGSDTLVYAQKISDTEQKVYLRKDNQERLIGSYKPGRIGLKITEFDGDWFLAVSSGGDGKTYIYKNPQKVIRSVANSTGVNPINAIGFADSLANPTFSANSRFILVNNDKKFGVFDAEKVEIYTYNIDDTINLQNFKPKWMDGHRIMYLTSHNMIKIVDFDNNNKQTLVKSDDVDHVFFDRDYTVMYTVLSSPATESSLASNILNYTDLRLDNDK